jgi:hypothetical protein
MIANGRVFARILEVAKPRMNVAKDKCPKPSVEHF